MMRRILSTVGSANAFTFFYGFPFLSSRNHFSISVDLIGKGTRLPPTGDDALEEVSLVGLDRRKLLGASRIRLIDPQLVLDVWRCNRHSRTIVTIARGVGYW